MWSDPSRDYAAGPLPLEHEGFTRNIETGVLTGARWVDRLQSRFGAVRVHLRGVQEVLRRRGQPTGRAHGLLHVHQPDPAGRGLPGGHGPGAAGPADGGREHRRGRGARTPTRPRCCPRSTPCPPAAWRCGWPWSACSSSGTAGVFSLYAAVNQIFAVPYRHRYGFGPRYLRVFFVVFIMASAVLVVGVGSSLVGSLFEVPGANRAFALIGSVALFSTAFYWSVKILSRRRAASARAPPGLHPCGPGGDAGSPASGRC